MREGLHVGHLIILGELGYQVGITAGDVQRIRIIGVGYQLEEIGAIDLSGGTKLQFLVMAEFLAKEYRRKQAERIGVTEMLIRCSIQQLSIVFGAFSPEPDRVAEVLDSAGESDIGGIDAVVAGVVAGAKGIQDRFAVGIEGVGVAVIGEVLDGSPETCLYF